MLKSSKIGARLLWAILIVAAWAVADQHVAALTPAATSLHAVHKRAAAEIEPSRRSLRAMRFTAQQDSLIRSKAFEFLPVNIEANGGSQLLYNAYYYVAITPNHVELHLPWVAARNSNLVTVLNLDSEAVQNYQALARSDGWEISFALTNDREEQYQFQLSVNTVTGHATLEIQSESNRIRYLGSIQKNEPLEHNTAPSYL